MKQTETVIVSCTKTNFDLVMAVWIKPILVIVVTCGCFLVKGIHAEETYAAKVDSSNVLLIQKSDTSEWSYPCSSTFTINDGRAACEQMGFPGIDLIRQIPIPNASIPILNVEFNCISSRSALHECLDKPNECDAKDVVVEIECSPLKLFSARLTDKSGTSAGRVEVYAVDKNNIKRWIPLCQESLDNETAMAICKDIGYHGVLKKNYRKSWVKGMEALKFDCGTGADTLSKCEQKQTVECTSDVAASVLCDFRFLGQLSHTFLDSDDRIFGFSVYTGNRRRANICAGTTKEDDDVLCRTVDGWSMNTSMEVMPPSYYDNTPKLSYSPNCSGHEGHLRECPANFESRGECDVDTLHGVKCNLPPTWSVRIKDLGADKVPFIYQEGSWRIICFQNFTKLEATVICKALGYTGVDAVYPRSEYVARNAANVQCKGTEETIESCPVKTIGCNVKYVVAMRCIQQEPKTEPSPEPTPEPVIDDTNHGNNAQEKEESPMGDSTVIWIIPVVAVICIVSIVIICMLVIMFRKPKDKKQKDREPLLEEPSQKYSSTD